MVAIVRHLTPDGETDFDVLLDRASGLSSARRKTAEQIFALIADEDSRKRGLEVVEQLLGLKMDVVTVIAGMAMFAVQRGDVDLERLPDDVATLVAAVLRLSSTEVLSMSDSAVLSSESKSQTDNVRHLLIALIDDPRVAVVKLAERVVTLRGAKEMDSVSRELVAREAMEFYAPLASRLGIWQLKWSLEDLAFRYLHPRDYQEIASKLDARREARERQVEAIRQDLEFRLAAAGIDAEVHGRAKHIYSIWRKMREKSIDIADVHDAQALRVLVDSIDKCYRVLGVVHTSWPHIPTEFDDYIANPKENGYRSIHTAVIGPIGKTLEVQIRTRDMHDESELGMCAHWAYKDGGMPGGSERALQSRKMDWLRTVLEWHDGLGFRSDGMYQSLDRIFVSTPQGHVLDLSPDATPVDFAYRIHTEVGHRCRGARVDGRQVPLNRRLSAGECVEVVTGEEEQPRREWLNPALGYVNTSRARTKIQAWFRNQLAESNINAGRALLEESASRLGFSSNFVDLAARSGYGSEDELFMAVGVGDRLVIDLVKLVANSRDEAALSEPQENTGTFQGIVVHGRDRDGLLRDVAAAIAELSISVVATNARAEVPGESATLSLELHVSNLAELARAIDHIRRVPDVSDVRRTRIQ